VILGLASLALDVHPQDNRPVPFRRNVKLETHTKFILQWACRLNRSNVLCFKCMEITARP